jgi:hypothetical protein
MSNFNFSNNSNTNNTSTSNPFGTVGSAWMNDYSASKNGGVVFQNDTGQGKHSAGQRINSAPTKLTNNNNQKKANWGDILGKKKHSNKRKFGTTNHKRSMSLNLSILDNDMSGLQVLSPKSKPRNNNTTTNNNNGIVKPFALNGSSSSSNSNNTTSDGNKSDVMNGYINTPKHKRSKSDNSVTASPSFRMGNSPNLIKTFLSNRSVSALGKLRGSYKCGKCGVPKKGHVCPHEQPKQMQDAQTQCSFDINPNVESSQIRRLVQKLQEKGIISLSGSHDALHALLKNVDIPIAQYHQEAVKSATPAQIQVVQQAATGSTSSLSPTDRTKVKKTRKKNSKETKKNAASKNKNIDAATKSKKAVSKKNDKKITRKKRSPKAKLIKKSNNAALPKRVNSLRTFDSIDSTSSEDPFHMDMDPTDAFDYSEFDLTNDELTDDKWFGRDLVDDTNYDDAEMSAMLSA